MCVIVHKPAGQEFPEQEIRKCWLRNGDGAGFFSLNADGSFAVVKQIDSIDSFLNSEHVKNALKKESDSVFHFRIASRGGVSLELTHPFKINLTNKGKPCEAYLFHNGTISFLDTLPVGCSDTKFLASILEGLEIPDAIKILKNINRKGANEYVKNGRFVLCCPKKNKEYKFPVILGDSESCEKNGLWFSNLKHEGFVPKKVTTTYSVNFSGNSSYKEWWLNKSGEQNENNQKPEQQEFSEDIFFVNRAGAKTTIPSREDLIDIITKFYCEDSKKQDEVDAMRAVLIKTSNFNILPIRQLEAIALLCQQEQVADPICAFSELFDW